MQENEQKTKLFGEYTPDELIVEADFDNIEPFKMFSQYSQEELSKMPKIPFRLDRYGSNQPFMWDGKKWKYTDVD